MARPILGAFILCLGGVGSLPSWRPPACSGTAESGSPGFYVGAIETPRQDLARSLAADQPVLSAGQLEAVAGFAVRLGPVTIWLIARRPKR